MTIPITQANEEFRIKALHSLHVLDTSQEKEFDEITSLAAFLCNAEISLICLVDRDRQWFKSRYGLSIRETPRINSLCSIAISTPEKPLIIENFEIDHRFTEDYWEVGDKRILSYVGIPLINQDGYALGTLCIMDSSPKKLSSRQMESLHSLANQVVILFELNKKNYDLEAMQNELKQKNESLKDFARVISHDLKMPLANVITTSDLLKLKLGDKMDEESNEYFGYIKESSFSMSDYINDILNHYESDTLMQHQPELFPINDLIHEIAAMLMIESGVQIEFPDPNISVYCNKSALKQIFFNLIGNSIKYNDKKEIKISITAKEDNQFYYFTVSDNGMGIPKEKLNSIFDLFSTANVADRNGNKGNGIGLSTVKKIVEGFEGAIHVSSTLGEYTAFDFSIKKNA